MKDMKMEAAFFFNSFLPDALRGAIESVSWHRCHNFCTHG